MVTLYNQLFTLWRAKVPKEIIFLEKYFSKYLASVGLNINFYKIISWKPQLK